jgi:hypothetical protein
MPDFCPRAKYLVLIMLQGELWGAKLCRRLIDVKQVKRYHEAHPDMICKVISTDTLTKLKTDENGLISAEDEAMLAKMGVKL